VCLKAETECNEVLTFLWGKIFEVSQFKHNSLIALENIGVMEGCMYGGALGGGGGSRGISV